MLTLSLIKEIEIIGEAATKVSNDLKEKYSQIPWKEIKGMRNRLIHVYFDIDLVILWKTITKDLPPLKTMLEQIIKEQNDNFKLF